ncbi:MAG: hypothetical protein DRI83_04695 [Bacteroidetes bacterium]|nr:MAG: hypothetical protein DRI83_04695 [Bacteroidota bacterium]
MFMKKVLFLFVLIFAVSACKKDDGSEDMPPLQQEISFNISHVTTPEGLKSDKDWDCKPYEPDYLEVTLNGQSFFPKVFRIDGILYSQNIRLNVDPGLESVRYRIDKFLLWFDGDTPETDMPGLDDTVVMGTPEYSSAYSVYVAHPLNYSIKVSVFENVEISMDVLCVQADSISLMKYSRDIMIRERRPSAKK